MTFFIDPDGGPNRHKQKPLTERIIRFLKNQPKGATIHEIRDAVDEPFDTVKAYLSPEVLRELGIRLVPTYRIDYLPPPDV